MAGQKKKIVFIINPVSGTGKQKCIEKAIEKYLDNQQFESEIRFTEFAGHAVEIARQASKEQVDIVVAVGGDGSVNEVARGIIGSDCTMGIIPLGSGNGLARYLRIPLSPGKAIEIINQGKSKKIDTCKVNDQVFVSVAGVGFDAHVADKFAGSKQRGFLRYFSISFTEYKKYKLKKYRLSMDGVLIKRKAMAVVFANSDQFGYNTIIAPNASITDGLLDVCIIGKPSLLRMPFVAYMLFTRRFDKLRYVETYKAAELKIRRKKDLPVNVDGEPMMLGQDLEVKVVPESLSVIMP